MNPPSDDRVERLKSKLYSPGSPHVMNKNIRPLQEKNLKVDTEWEKPPEETGDLSMGSYMDLPQKAKTGAGPWVFVALAFIFFIISSGFAWYYITQKQGVTNNVAIYVTGPVSVDGGNVASVDITIENRNPFPLELVDLIVTYPPGSKEAVEGIEDLDTVREGLGTIGAGESTTKTVKAILFGAEKEKKTITARAEYHIPNSNASYDNEKTVDILLLTSPVEFALEVEKEVTVNQEVNLLLRLRSNSVSDLRGMVVEAEYPAGFSFKESIPAPILGENVWKIDLLPKQSTSTISIRGTFSGEADAERFFRFKAGVGDKIKPNVVTSVFATSLEKITLVKEFIGTNLTIDDSAVGTNLVTTLGRNLSGKIDWVNNLDVPITDLVIEATIGGESLDRRSVNAFSGFYRSSENKIVWNKNTNDQFEQISPGQSGSVNFGFATLPFSPDAPKKNQSIVIDISVSAKRPSESNVPEEIKSTVVKTIKVESDPGLAARSVYYVGPFTNSGPLPPRVEQHTTYTVVWTLANTLNDLTQTQIEGYLPPHASFTGQFSPTNERVTYDEKTGKIVWNVGLLAAGTGYTRPSRELIFQVDLFPSANQIGETLLLVDKQKISATDSFTNTRIERMLDESVSTRISTDPNYTTQIDRVTE